MAAVGKEKEEKTDEKEDEVEDEERTPRRRRAISLRARS
jgi:hypothetical protein